MLNTIAIISVAIGFASAAIVIIDILAGHRQKMKIMNFVYPITGLYAGPFALLIYFTIGRKSVKKSSADDDSNQSEKPFWQSVATGALHCGAGCTLGDIIAESLLIGAPFILFGKALFGAWVVDYGFALAVGIIFQYFAIVPMRNISIKEGLVEAFKADFLSLTSWQIGMYGGMAIATFLIFNRELKATEPVFWFVMQGAMICGFLTAYPMNWFLIRKGIKEKM